ncbi:TIGD1 [Cordylochernes scorpioides]|uniref:TIGD1 n=1 Tax=Cordylochernes scorpioides TaxID=51811 RepID=A0ABY6L6T4_9ARAC|nr:TIGD1 [Cordylochernes scorpioides]
MGTEAKEASWQYNEYEHNIIHQKYRNGKMEQALMLWIEDQTQKKRVPIDTGAITNKALRIYEKIVEQLPSSSTEKKPNFLASHGWFERFKIRHSLHSLKLKGELASGDVDAAQEYPANFAEFINDNSYTPDQFEKVSLTKYDEEELVPVTFTAKVIREGLALGRKLGNHFMQNDTNVERALRFQRDINRCLAQYEEVYKDLTKNSKQLLITDFITISHNVNISASNIESAQITSSDESECEPSIPKKRMRAISDSDEG